MLLTGVLIYVPEEERAAIAVILCMLAMCNLNYFRPHKSLLLFWLSQLSFLITSAKYIFAMVLSLIDQERTTNAVRRVYTIGTLLIVLDVSFLLIAAGTIVAVGVLLRRRIRAQEQRSEGEQGRGSDAASTGNAPTGILPVRIAPTTHHERQSDSSSGDNDRGTLADHELAVDALMEASDAHAEDRRRNITSSVNDLTATMLRWRAGRRLKESKRMRSVQVFKDSTTNLCQ